MFKNKIKYSLLVGSLYNVKCNYIFNVYINGKKTSITKKINCGTLFDIYEHIGDFQFEGKKFASYEEYKKKDPSETFDDYLQWVLFYKEKNDKNSELKDCLYDCEMKHSIEGMDFYTSGVSDKQISQYSDIKSDKDGDIKIDVYFVKKAKYEIINKTQVYSDDFINSLNVHYNDKTTEESVICCLGNIEDTNFCLTYKKLLEKLNLFDVYIDGEKINEDDKKYITPDEAKKLYLLPKLDFQKIKPITLYFNNNEHFVEKHIKIPSYVTLKYIKESSYYNSKCKGKICYDISHHKGLEFYEDSTYNNKIGDNDIVKGDIYVKVKQYFVTTFTDKWSPYLLNIGKFVDVNKLNDYINEYKTKEDLIGKKHYISPVIGSDKFKPNVKYEDFLTNHICVTVISKEDEPKEEIKEEKHIEKPEEESKEEKPIVEKLIDDPKVDDLTKGKSTGEKLTDGLKVDDSKVDDPTEDNPTDDTEMVKKTALIKQCKDLLNKIKALDSSYDITINDSDSVKNLESLKIKLKTKLNELKNKKPNPIEVPKNPEPTSTNGGNNSTDGGNIGKKTCGNCCCKNGKESIKN